MQKQKKIRSQAMRDSANGQPCTLEILGACNNRTDTTVLAHLPDGSGGIMGGKYSDISCAYACSSCHDRIDGRVSWPTGEQIHEEWYLRRAMIRTLQRMVDAGIITIKGVKA